FIALQSIEKGEWCRDLCRYQLSRHRDSGRTCLRRKLRLVHESEPELRGGARQDRRTDGGGTQKAGRLPALHLRAHRHIIIGWMLAGLLGHLGAGQVTFRNGIISAAFIWFGFILTTMVVNFSFSGRDRRLLAIDAGNWLIVLLVIGAVIGGIGV